MCLCVFLLTLGVDFGSGGGGELESVEEEEVEDCGGVSRGTAEETPPPASCCLR